VRWGKNDDIYFQWLNDLYFEKAQSASVIADMVRYTVGRVPVPVEAGVIPPYAAIGKLFRFCKVSLL
jgi:hypothetical protein